MILKQSLVVAGVTILPRVTLGQGKPEPEYLNVAYAYDSGSNKLMNLERQNASPAAKDALAPGEYAIHQPGNPTLFCFGIDAAVSQP